MNYFLGHRQHDARAGRRLRGHRDWPESPRPRHDDDLRRRLVSRRRDLRRHDLAPVPERRPRTHSSSSATSRPRSDSIQHAGIGTAMTSTGVAAGFFQGTLDEVRIWNVARSAADIQATMGGPLATPRGQPDRPMGAQRSDRARRPPTARAATTTARSRADRRGSPARPSCPHRSPRVTTA